MKTMKSRNVSFYLCFLLRHRPDILGLNMDNHGWVSVKELIEKVNADSKYTLTREMLQEIVDTDEKGRYILDNKSGKIKCCQGHSIPWVEPELRYEEPPEFLYHGTSVRAYEKIKESGAIRKMKRHAVHMTANLDLAWKAAERWHAAPIVLKITTAPMLREGVAFGVTENDVWCAPEVPVKYIDSVLTDWSRNS